MTYESWKDTPHPMVETWATEWAIAVYAGTDWTWIERIELARLALRERARAKAMQRVVDAACYLRDMDAAGSDEDYDDATQALIDAVDEYRKVKR